MILCSKIVITQFSQFLISQLCISNSPDKPPQKMSTRSRQPSDSPTPAGRKFQQKDIPIILNEISEKMDHFNKQSKAQTNIMNNTRESGNSAFLGNGHLVSDTLAKPRLVEYHPEPNNVSI